MKRYGLIGRPLGHSFSAGYFAAKFRREGITGCDYALYELPSIEALPELLDGYKFQKKEPGRPKKEKFDAYRDITEHQHRISLEAAFTLKDEYGYQELAEALKSAYASVGVPLSDNKVVSLITTLKNKRMIVQENGKKYRFMPDFHY